MEAQRVAAEAAPIVDEAQAEVALAMTPLASRIAERQREMALAMTPLASRIAERQREMALAMTPLGLSLAELDRQIAQATAPLALGLSEMLRSTLSLSPPTDMSEAVDTSGAAAPPPRCAVRTDRPLRRVRRESRPNRAIFRRRRFSRRTEVSISGERCRADGRGARMEPLSPGGQIEYEQPHARDRMAQFGITEEQVRATLERPDRIWPALDLPPTDPCNIYLRSIGGRRCKVYVRIGSDPMRVATVRWHGE